MIKNWSVYYLFCIVLVSSSFAFSQQFKGEHRFDNAMKVVMKHEGVLSNDKADPGGITKHGISLRFLKQNKIDVDGDGDSDKYDILGITTDLAHKIYMENWWKRYNYYLISSDQLATKILDVSVNAGPSRCHKLVKQSLNQLYKTNYKLDSSLSFVVIKKINQADSKLLHEAIRQNQLNFYKSLVKRNPELQKFLKGWSRRANW